MTGTYINWDRDYMYLDSANLNALLSSNSERLEYATLLVESCRHLVFSLEMYARVKEDIKGRHTPAISQYS